MTYALGLLVVVLGLVISVALHELGHMVPAKKFGAMVPEYYVGFGPTLYSRKAGETTYGVKALPLGGYVRILGMFPEPTGQPKLKPNGAMKLSDQAKEQSAEELAAARADGLTGKAFYQLKTYQKLIVMFGGPLMNLLLAFLLTAVVVMGLGWREASTTLAEVTPGSPAAAAGIQAGDQIVGWNGAPTPTWGDVRAQISDSGMEPAEVTIQRAGTETTVQVTPELTPEGPRVGIVADETRVRGGLGQAVSGTGEMLGATASAIVRLPVTLWDLAVNLFNDEPRDPEGALSIVGVAQVAGEITSTGGPGGGDGAGGWDLADRAALLLSLLASLNIALFVFNLLPLPPLDGGHIAGALWGGAKNTFGRLRGQQKPKPADTSKLVPLSYGVFAVLMVLTVVLVVADFVKPMNIFG